MKAGKKDRVFEIVTTVLLVMILIVALYPLYFSLIASISSPRAVYQGRVLFLPADVTLDGYRKIFADESIWTGFGNGLLYTIVGTLLNVVFTIPLAYALSRKEFPFGGVFMKIMVFTMYFYGGIIPLYFVVKHMGMLDSIWSIVLPTLISTYNMIIARSYFMGSIPEELKEAAFLDGCGYVGFFFRVALPLSKSLIAVMVLFYAAKQWNSYFEPMIYLSSESRFPLQLVLRTILIDSQNSLASADASTVADMQQLVDLLKYGYVVVSSIPMLVFYPFVQKHFVKGVMLGAVKG